MNLSAAARIAAYGLAMLAAAVPALARSESPRVVADSWREPLEHAAAALANDDPLTAQRAWEQAYRSAVHARATEGLLAVGHAYLRIGEAARDRSTAVARARRIFLTALFQARERREAAAVAAAAAAFASLGDREIADRGFQIAIAVATERGDTTARERIATLQTEAAETPIPALLPLALNR